jgi:hypothetical protein
MVPLECYEGSGEDFQVLEGTDCEVSPFFNMSADTRLVNGCYVFVTKALIASIPEDIKHFAEYRTRLRFMFAVCRGIIGEMFQNNWVNGNLYMPSFQKKSIYGWGVDQTELVSVSFPNTSSEIVTFDYDGRANIEMPLNGDDVPYTYNLFINDELIGENVTAFPFLKNDAIRIVITGPTMVIPIGFTITLDITKYPRYKYCGDPEQRNDELKYQGPIYFNNYTNTFYYRSTPYNSQTNQYVGQKSTRIDKYNGSNERNIWFPTTISELGPKDRFIYEVSLDPEFEAFVMDRLRSTTYGENSNLINLFIVSRLRSSNFIQNLLGLGESSIGALFSRDENTVQSRFRDARVDGDYAQLTSIASELGVTPFLEGDYSDSQVYIDSDNIGVWFESDTPLRRVITNGAVTYGIDPDGPDYIFGYSRTQEVPYYMWKMEFYTSEDNNLFGTERNTWHTTDIYSSGYQSDDFFNNVPLKYMKPNNGYGLGYIYNKTLSDDTYNQPPGTNPNFSRFKVGAPFFYYFGLKRGRTALTRFIKKYIEIS